MSQTVAENMVVSFHYVLKNGEGEVLDQSGGDEPMMYLHGHDNIVPGLERKLTGRAIGDKLEVVVAPGDGYGESDPGAKRTIPRDAFPPDAPIEVGVSFVIQTPDGDMVPMWIVGANDKEVSCDLNHPLAGVTLHFAVELVAMRDATPEELEHGHPHGPGGHHHH